MDTLNEKQYIQQLKKGSRSAFDKLYKLYARRLYAYSYQYTKSHQDTEEIVQDIFVKLWLHRETIQQENSIKYLLFTMTKNQLINAYRSRINSPIFEEYINYCNQQQHSIDDTSQKVLYDDFCLLVENAKKHLSDTQCKIFDLNKLHQLSLDEIADELSISKQTVKNQLSLSLKILRKQLNKYMKLLIIFFFC